MGLVATPRSRQGRDGNGAVSARGGRAHHPDLQPVHLFHLLTSTCVRPRGDDEEDPSYMREGPQRPLSREEIARIEVGHTDIRRGLARLLTVLFLVAIVLVPVGQQVWELIQWRSGQRPSPMPQAAEILGSGRDAERMWRSSALPLYDRVFAVNRVLLREIEQYEDRLEEE